MEKRANKDKSARAFGNSQNVVLAVEVGGGENLKTTSFGGPAGGEDPTEESARSVSNGGGKLAQSCCPPRRMLCVNAVKGSGM
jgi:hypothetical protein